MDLHTSKQLKMLGATFICWLVALLIFFPIFWMVLTSFKTEFEAISLPPKLFFTPTLENYALIFERTGYARFAWNSVVISVGSSLLGMLLAVPAAYAMAFYPSKRTKSTLLWMLSTKMLPPVGVLIPIYLLFRDFALLDTKLGLTIIFTMMNLPIMVWMIYTYFKEIPVEILEASRMDGASPRQEIMSVIIPISMGGLASSFLLALILSWNEAFWSLNLTASKAAPLTAFIASYSKPEGLFWAKLSAASTLAVAPIVIFGWLSMKQLVRGLTFGAVK
ncbi:carbohydrate ABC transporter permease [Salinispirillum marinum]|uniref:Carbohydrate ABC transporter permease n=2 Tax=Saccharospirillaceae TaxID=255527 RepID=A0ABV8BHV5_9GAMM